MSRRQHSYDASDLLFIKKGENQEPVQYHLVDNISVRLTVQLILFGNMLSI